MFLNMVVVLVERHKNLLEYVCMCVGHWMFMSLMSLAYICAKEQTSVCFPVTNAFT